EVAKAAGTSSTVIPSWFAVGTRPSEEGVAQPGRDACALSCPRRAAKCQPAQCREPEDDLDDHDALCQPADPLSGDDCGLVKGHLRQDDQRKRQRASQHEPFAEPLPARNVTQRKSCGKEA